MPRWWVEDHLLNTPLGSCCSDCGGGDGDAAGGCGGERRNI